ncbi:TPA: hypothetical protein QCI16_004355 [Enterobacter ludwigii]|nr:hypothetical protein [Enterobacter ludwigii]HDR2600142.1 hypothetical protein [Enterobacter ludwigii]
MSKPTYDELAAENAALKSVITDIHSELYGHGFAVAGWHLNGALKPLDSWFEENNWEPETPATDAFLAEVRAAARNELIDELEARFTELAQTSPTPELRSGAAGAAGFVSTFRKGVQS